MDYLARIKTLTGVFEQDELLIEIIQVIEEKILLYLGLNEVPSALGWIVVELSIARFNRIGSEGMSSESVDGGTSSYIEDELGQYKVYLDNYVRQNTRNKGWKLF